MQLVRNTFERYNGVYGYRQVQLFLYQDKGAWMNHKKVLRLMQKMGLRSRARRKYRCNRTWNNGDRAVRNILNRRFHAGAPNQKWVTDITQYRVGDT
ncbi:IS3 family transposase [Paenibacillus aquistagni]|uniref:IS3 family transposase n=1 Tax=Paenibacillus aquistagni TaxID=1852522 RepID=UPI00145A8A40|nr:IS3 family transposase [Paenibacillus aquistagni]NMM53672.1 transposase [Paenibacillus aquistagni]